MHVFSLAAGVQGGRHDGPRGDGSSGLVVVWAVGVPTPYRDRLDAHKCRLPVCVLCDFFIQF